MTSLATRILGAAALALGIADPGWAQAADYPNHPIELVVPYPGGGGTDVLARAFAEAVDASTLPRP